MITSYAPAEKEDAMWNKTRIALLALLLPSEALAQDMMGDAAAGEALFADKCVSCHVVENDAGEVLAGYAARSGANLYDLPGRVPGSVPDAQYSDHLVTYGQMGAVWEEENFVDLVPDPIGFLREVTGAAPSKMPLS